MLAGGAGSRLGGIPKGLERVGGARIVDRVADALRAVTPDIVVAANAADAADWLPGVPVYPDLHPRRGGLAGVEAALALGRDVLVVAWDMPFVTSALLQALAGLAAPDVPLIAPESDSPHGFEPFCAYYSLGIRDDLARFLDSGGAAHAFVTKMKGVRFLRAAEVARFGDPAQLFLSVNSPTDLERARAIAARAQ